MPLPTLDLPDLTRSRNSELELEEEEVDLESEHTIPVTHQIMQWLLRDLQHGRPVFGTSAFRTIK